MVVWVVPLALRGVVASIASRPALGARRSGPGRLLFQWRWSIVALWFTAVFLLIMVRFWDYWSTLL